jgi:hypothetical protein
MTKPYFRQVPNFEYVSRNPGDKYISEYIPVKNLFKRGKLREDIFGDLAFFEKYSIIGDERPDNIAYKFYGDSTLDWVVLLSNNILNIQSEWPMTQLTFDKVMLEKYASYENLYSGIHHYETEEITNSLGITILKGGIKISPTWKTNGNFLEIDSSKIGTIFSGDAITPSTEVTVYSEKEIPNLEVGSQFAITNVVENEYNGQYVVSDVIIRGQNGTIAFKYNLTSTPNIAFPQLADPKKEEILFTIRENSSIAGSSYYYEYWDAGLGYSVLIPSTSFVKEITNYEYELSLENKKRDIYLLKPRYLNVVFNDMDSIMPYKKGSVQYRNATLKRGDNIRLYE